MDDKKEVIKNEIAIKPTEDLMIVEYQSPYGMVRLDKNIIRKYFTKGNDNITDSEILIHIETCRRMKLDPYVTGEVHLVKYKDFPASTIVGYNTYKRRAEENPNYKGKEDGIVVQRGNEIVKKNGACLYPGEIIIGGWCNTKYMRGNTKATSYKEVSFAEYKQDNRQWNGKPAMMINKVAQAQSLRDAFPTEMQGMYIPEEIASKDVDEADFKPVKIDKGEVANSEVIDGEELMTVIPVLVNESDRKTLFDKAQEVHGKDGGITWLKEELLKLKLTKTSELNTAQLETLLKKLDPAEEPEEVGIEQTELPFDVEEQQ